MQVFHGFAEAWNLDTQLPGLPVGWIEGAVVVILN